MLFPAQLRATHGHTASIWEENMFHMVTRRSLAVVGLAAALAAPLAWAQDAPPARVRGTIERIEGPVYVVKSRDGAELKIVLAENAVAAGLVKATLADIKQGSFVGIAAMPQPDGAQRALEVLIFPEAMRGTGEGHYPWDLQPKSTMTNANVEQLVTGVDGQTLTVKYKDGEKKIIVPPDVPIVTFAPGDKARLEARDQDFHRCLEKAARWNASGGPCELWQGWSYAPNVMMRQFPPSRIICLSDRRDSRDTVSSRRTGSYRRSLGLCRASGSGAAREAACFCVHLSRYYEDSCT